MPNNIAISNWKSFQRNTLQGFFSITLPSGMVIHNCQLFKKGAARWIGLPSKNFTKQGGGTGYKKLIEFECRERADAFRDAVLEGIDAAELAPSRSTEAAEPPVEIADDDIPF